MSQTTQYYELTIIETTDPVVALANDNPTKIDTALHNLQLAVDGKKPIQTAVSDPTASGDSLTFIATLSQNANGVISPTKKTVKAMTGANSSTDGAVGLVPKPLVANRAQFLRGDGAWATPPAPSVVTTSANGLMSKEDKSKLDGIETGAQKNPGAATSSAYGLVKIGYTASGKNYAVQLDSSGKMYVNVPWTDNNTTYAQATSSTLGLVKIGYTTSGKNYAVQLDTNGKMFVNVPWTNTTYSEATSSALGLVKVGYTTSGKNYAVQLDSGKMYVNVPWTDTNTTYSQATSSALGLVKIGYVASGKNYAVQLDTSGKAYVTVPWSDTTYSAATSSAYGLVKIGYSASGKNYAVQLDSSGKMYVSVPWTDTNTTYSAATSSAYGLVKIGYSTNAKNYAVQLDSSGKAYVNVPWTDTNTTYSAATSSAYGLVKIGYTTSGKNYAVQLDSGKMYVNVPWTDTNTWRAFEVKSFSYDTTVPASGTRDISANNFGLGLSGYTAVAVAMFNPGSPNLYVTALNSQATGTGAVMTIKNTVNTALSVQAWIAILYLKNG